jgi:hypothetical protein
MKKLLTIFIIVAIIIISGSINSVDAATSNFSISPTPIPWYEFQQSQFDLRLGGSYAKVTGDTDKSGDKITLEGGGINLGARYAFNNYIGLDFMFNFAGMGGDITKDTNLDVFVWTWNPNIEVQVLNTDRFNLILFGGIIWALAKIDVYDYTVNYTYTGVTANLSGPQFGIQASLKINPVVISPFFIYQRMSGSYNVNGTTGDVPATSMKSFGIDIVLVPINLTLSTIFQQVSASSQNTGYKTIFLTVSYDFRWGGKESGS